MTVIALTSGRVFVYVSVETDVNHVTLGARCLFRAQQRHRDPCAAERGRLPAMPFWIDRLQEIFYPLNLYLRHFLTLYKQQGSWRCSILRRRRRLRPLSSL